MMHVIKKSNKMKATELRIGNYYRWLHEESESVHIVDIDFLKAQHAYDIDPQAEEFSRGWWASPIPLTEEILLKCGFERSGLFLLKEDIYIYYSTDTLIEAEFCYHVNYRELPLKYLHQLQNAFYFLSGGTELTVKL